MTKKILNFAAVLVFLACIVSLSYGAIIFKIGDKDGFGFTPEELEGAVNISGDPADTDGDGKLEPGEFLPEINGNDSFDELPVELGGDGFDYRSEEETNAKNGAQFTDVSYNLDKDPIWIRMFEVSFIFDVSVLERLPLQRASLKLIYSDFDGDCPDPEATSEPSCKVCTEIYADDQVIGNVPLTNPRQGGISAAEFDVPVELLEDGVVTITFESADSIEFDVATLRVDLETEDVRPQVRLRKLDWALNEDPVPGGPAGTYTVKYRLKNRDSNPIWAPFIKFKTKDPGILLLNADGGPEGNGATFTPDVGTDLLLSPGEKVTFDLVIGLTVPAVVPSYRLKIRGISMTP
jgi:hypothetical protein